MNRRIILLALPSLAAMTLACSDWLFDDRSNVYEGPPVVEFAPILPAGTHVRNVTFAAGSEVTETVTVRINYVAPPASSALTGELAVVAESTATEGQHFTFPNGTSYTIAAGANSVETPVELMAAGLTDGQSVSVVLELQDGQGFQASVNYKRFEIRVSKAAG